MTLEARNKEAIDAQVDALMRDGECSLVPFFSYKLGTVTMNQGFGEIGSERLAEADTRDCELLQIVLACLNGEHEKAQKLAKFFEQPLRDAAEKLVDKAMEQECDE